MITKRLFLVLALAPAIAFLGGCPGNGGGNNDAGVTDAGGNGNDAGTQDAGPPDCSKGTIVAVSGTVSMHPVLKNIDPTTTLAGTNFTLLAAATLLANKDTPLTDDQCNPATMTLVPDAVDPTTAPFDFAKVNTTSLALGLIGVANNTASGAGMFINTATGLANAQDAQAGDVTGATAIAVSKAEEGTLATAAGMNPGDLVSGGFILGMFVDAQSQPVSGVTLYNEGSSGPTSPVATAMYPTADFSGLTTTGATSANGLFIVTDTGLLNLTGVKTGMTFASQQAAKVPSSCFVMFLAGQ